MRYHRQLKLLLWATEITVEFMLLTEHFQARKNAISYLFNRIEDVVPLTDDNFARDYRTERSIDKGAKNARRSGLVARKT